MNENNSSKQILLSVLGVAILVVAVVGVSFAAFTFSKTGTKPNQITTGTVKMTYTEGESGLSLTDALPMTDVDGKKISATDQVFDFTVSADINGDTEIQYDIAAKEVPFAEITTKAENATALDAQYVKIYLEETSTKGGSHVDGGKVSDVLTCDKIAEAALDSDTGKPANELSLIKDTFTETKTRYYRLRMWVSDQYNPQTANGKPQTYAVKINVYAKAEAA